MDYMQLESILENYTEEEKRNLKTADAVSDYSDYPHLTIQGKSVPIMTHADCSLALNHYGQRENLVISKHPRFMIVSTHVHEWIEMSYIYRGTLDETIDGKEYVLHEGQLCIIDTETPHAIAYTHEDTLMINVLMRKEYFSAKFLSRFSSQNAITDFIIHAISKSTRKDNFILFSSQNSRRLRVLFQELMCETLEPSLNHEDILDSCMAMIFLELIQIHSQHLQESHISGHKVSLLSVLQYIEANYTDCTLEQTAAHFHLNPSYLSTLMKKQLHSSYKETLQKTRLRHACQLLLNTDLSVTEVSNTVGYENVSFFYRKFNEEYACSPGEYRNTH